MHASRQLVAIIVSAAALLLVPVGPVSAADEGSVDAKAMKSIEGMSDFLAGTKQFSVTLDVAYDVMQDWGQKLEFGETRVVTVRRPDRLRVDTTDRDGAKSGVVFDGHEIAVFNVNDKVYATTAQPGPLDESIAHFVNVLGMRFPMAAILQGHVAKDAKQWAREIRSVGMETIGGVPCDHVALHGNWEDVQLWIARGDRPLLQRIVITYARAEGQPQFSAQFRDWNPSPDVADAVFAFAPQAGATKIAFKSRQTIPGTAAQGGGAKP